MVFYWLMFLCDLLIPILMLVSGRIMWKHPPKSINPMIGYRTSRSMKNADTWKFAHDYCGRLWWKIGWIMLIPSILVQIPFYGRSEHSIGVLCTVLCLAQCVGLIASIIPTERALKRNFTEEGLRR
jgi:uncharacterized membrane protein